LGAAPRDGAEPQGRAAGPPAEMPEGPVNVPAGEFQLAPYPPSLLRPDPPPIDLNTPLPLANLHNPQLLLAPQPVVQADARRMLAAAQLLPTINGGMNYDTHTGNLQQSNGNILSVNRSALYVGAGSNAVAAGTVNIPGIVLTGNVAVGVYGFLTSRQVVVQREFASVAQRNQSFLATTLAYSELLRAEGRRAIALQVRGE